MKAQKPVAPATPSSLKDAGYRFASQVAGLQVTARYVLDNDNEVAVNGKVSKETADQLREGFALRWQENNPAKRYDSNQWTPSETGDVDLTLAYCLSFSQQAFGQLKSETPMQHSAIKGVRDSFSKYSSNNLGELHRKIKQLLNEGKTATRSQAKAFREWLTDQMDTIKAPAKTAGARGDETADEVRARMAIDAFVKVYDQR